MELHTIKDSLMKAKREDADIAQAVIDAREGRFNERNLAAITRFKLELFPELIAAAVRLNLESFRKQIEFYAVSYISDLCVNNCRYCGHKCSLEQKRETLTPEEMALDFRSRLRFGPSEICILAGEHPSITPELLMKARGIALAEDVHHALRTICFNVAPMTEEQYRQMRANGAQIRVFQESYDEETYRKNHTSGPKARFEFRLNSQERALQAGIKLVGVGVLMGLNEENTPWEHFGNDFELMAMIKHSYHLKGILGSFPNTASLPRHQKSPGSDFVTPNRVDDVRYILYHAILRIFLPSTKLIVTNREAEGMRDILRPMINIEDLAARPGVGGNFREETHMQNELGDKRGPEELIRQLRDKGFIPLVPKAHPSLEAVGDYLKG